MPLRVIFMGTPDFAVPTLKAVHADGHEVAAVYTQPPRPGGRRGLDLRKSAVQVLAEALDLTVRTPTSLKNPIEQSAFTALDADVAVVVAYGLLLPPAILAATRHGALNGHASALPRWRGAAPIQRAVMAGDDETAMTIMKMDEGLDTGPVSLSRRVTIGPDETAGELHDRMAEVGATLMSEALQKLEKGELVFTPQPEAGATYAQKIGKDETRIDWGRPAEVVHNHIRGLSPFPGAWCEMEIGGRNERVKILASRLARGSGAPGEMLEGDLKIACATGAIEPVRLQRAGGKVLDAATFLHGSAIGSVS